MKMFSCAQYEHSFKHYRQQMVLIVTEMFFFFQISFAVASVILPRCYEPVEPCAVYFTHLG